MRKQQRHKSPAKPKLFRRTDIIILAVLLAVPSILAWRLLTKSEPSVATTAQAASLHLPQQSEVEPSGITFRPIATAQLGERVDGTNSNRDEVDLTLEEPAKETWRELALWMTKPDGKRLDIGLLRAVEWIEFNDAREGGQVYLDLPELGVVGWAEVLSIRSCPPIATGPGSVITGTFRHESSNQILDITVAGEDEPIGVTDNHPFWSVDRQEFVEAGELEVDESLDILDGTAEITSITERGPPEPVYNLEVHGEHVYRVSSLGVLVHNCYEPTVSDSKLKNYVRDLYKGARGPNPIGTGSTADALRNEIRTGLPTHGVFHIQKTQQYINGLTKWLKINPSASHHDRLVAQSLLDDLKGALGGK